MQQQSLFQNVYVVAKFFISKAPNGETHCISRTLGKFSIIDNSFQGTVNNQDIWLCQITKEIKPNKNSGAFVLLPLKLVDPKSVRKIIPGFYDFQKIDNGIALVRPNSDPSAYWMLSKATRQIFSKKYHAVVVPICYQDDIKSDDDV